MNKLKYWLLVLVLLNSSLAIGKDKKTPVRTLDAVTIEGAVDVPQVLFITSSENARFNDGLGWSFVSAASDSLAPTAWPVRFSPFVFESQVTQNVDPVAAVKAPTTAEEK